MRTISFILVVLFAGFSQAQEEKRQLTVTDLQQFFVERKTDDSGITAQRKLAREELLAEFLEKHDGDNVILEFRINDVKEDGTVIYEPFAYVPDDDQLFIRTGWMISDARPIVKISKEQIKSLNKHSRLVWIATIENRTPEKIRLGGGFGPGSHPTIHEKLTGPRIAYGRKTFLIPVKDVTAQVDYKTEKIIGWEYKGKN